MTLTGIGIWFVCVEKKINKYKLNKLRELLVVLICGTVLFGCNNSNNQSPQSFQDEYGVFENTQERVVSTNLDTLPDLKQIVDGIEIGNRVESSHVNYEGRPSDQYKKYEQLKKVATVEQLTALTDHKNSAVRCYAFQALASKKADNVFAVLLKHLHDTSSVETQSGCTIMTELTGDYFINVVTPNYIDLDVYKLNQKERQTLDSILLYNKSIQLYVKSEVLRKLKPITENYDRIRELVAKERNTSALISLARYQKQNDKKLIASFLKNDNTQFSALYAVREFPDDYFYSSVKKVFEQEWKEELYDYSKWRICYQVLAKYPRQETIELFERTTSTKDEFRYETLCKYLLVAITKFPNKFYDPIKAKIKLSSFQMDEVKNELENDYCD